MTAHRDMTTGEVAKLLCVSVGTVMRWCDRGLLASHRIPGSRDRRIRRADVEAFCVQHQVPLATLERDAAETREAVS